MPVITKDFILASGSVQRLNLLKQIEYMPKKIEPADIDETPKKGERPSSYVKRMALEKALHISKSNPNEVVLGADTIIVIGTKIIQKSHTDDEQEKVMRLLSGRAHKVLTAVCVVDKKGKAVAKLNTTRLVVKKLSEQEIKTYVAGHSWVGSAGFKIESQMEAFVKKIIGSYSGIIGLPLYETKNLLDGVGVK